MMQTLTLKQARIEFTLALAELILFSRTTPCELAFAEGMDRTTEKDPTTDHMAGSLHEIGLAQDIDLFVDGVYQTETAAHEILGAWWVQYGIEHGLPLVWGGAFNDGNHYSLRWKGKA